jgi:hypothetical protein
VEKNNAYQKDYDRFDAPGHRDDSGNDGRVCQRTRRRLHPMQFKLLVAREMHAGQLVRGLVALSERRERRPDFYFVTAGAAR